MNFNYYNVNSFMGNVDIPDIYNFCLQAINDSFESFFISVSTKHGWSTIIEYGPVLITDQMEKLSGFVYRYRNFEVSDTKIFKIVDKFLNEPHRGITQAIVIEEDTFNEFLQNHNFCG